MSEVSSVDVKKLRERTGASIMECKIALEKAAGDIEKAQVFLKEQGFAKAGKKSERATSAGLVEAYIHGDGRAGSLIELRCETDFVARNPVFKELAHDLAMQVVVVNPMNLEELLASPFIKNESETIEQYISSKIALLGENIKIGQFVRFQIS